MDASSLLLSCSNKESATKCYGFFSLLLFKSASVLHKEFFQYLIEHQWCSSDDDFRKMYWVGSFYLLIINIESYQEVISSGIWITLTCLVLTSFQGTVWGHSRDGLEKFWQRITQLLTLSCNSPLCCSLLWIVEWRKLQERCMNLVHEISLMCLGKLSADCMWNKSVCLGCGAFSVC